MARILIAGGSLGGLMAANLLVRAGHEVTVLEKASGALDGRGAGIVTHSALVAGLLKCGLSADTALGVKVERRVALGAIGPQHHAVLAQMAMPQVLTSWSRLYQLLRGLIPQGVVHDASLVESVQQDSHGVTVTLTSRGEQRTLHGDLLMGADGIRSAVRQQYWPQAQPVYAGYIAWRGVCEESKLSASTLADVFDSFGFCLPPGEQLIGYPVAGPGNQTEVGARAYNFVWYRPASLEHQLIDFLTDGDGVFHANGIAPHKVASRHIDAMRADATRLLAKPFAEIITKTDQPFLQPIFDLYSSNIVNGRVALIGDAAFVARPHVGMGVTKAMQDAVALAAAIDQHGATPLALQNYHAARLEAGQKVVARGRQLGAYMQASGLAGASGHSKISRSATTVMQETAIDLDARSAAPPSVISPFITSSANAQATALSP
jgi:2-polyprenyl-6-methoxyphenol hydroxylase-like FAD-dependent oxidoreductase